VARKERRSAADERIEGLFLAGDWRQARREAPALDRLRPGPTAVLAFLAGLVFLAIVAAAGLWHR